MSTDVGQYFNSVVHQECDHGDWVDIEDHLKMMNPRDLALFAENLNLTPSDHWQDFLGAIQHKTWGELKMAYGRSTGHDW